MNPSCGRPSNISKLWHLPRATAVIGAPIMFGMSTICSSLVIVASVLDLAHAGFSSITTAEWKTLNQTVGGRLHAGTPAALPCFTRYNSGNGTTLSTPNSAACSAFNNGKTDGPTIASYFGGYEVPNWGQCVAKSQGCTLSALLPVDPVAPVLDTCYQGSVPSMYIDCQSVSDIQAGLTFVQKHNLPLVVKNTGHDHRGRSSGPDTFALWTHNIKANPQLSTTFVPDGCSASTGPALTYGAGSEFGDLYDYVHAKGYMLVGGASTSVGASGGWVQGGGHGALVNSYGLGVDNVLQMRVVLANGTFVTANRCQNTDLFFALRGGGGGTFGVVTETTSMVHQEIPMQYVSVDFGHLGLDRGSKYLSLLIANANRWASEGWGGYILPGLLDGTIGTFAAITPKLTLQQAKTSMQPLVDLAQSLGNIPVNINITTLPNGYYDFLQTPDADTVGGFTGLGYALSSRLVPRTLFTNDSQLLPTLLKLQANGEPNPAVPFYILMVTPAAYKLPQTDMPGGPGYTSVTPAWRSATWHIVMPTIWDPNDPTASGAGSVSQAFTNTHNAVQPLRDITPGSGAYQNEADLFEPNVEQSFWGQDNYARLLQIKKKYDPGNVFTCWNCIGWNSNDARYSCYPHLTT